LLSRPNGIVLVTGPTGSGKTTTLYAGLKKLNSPDLNIVTIEDPVEIRLPMVRQVQVNAEIGMTFAGALRSILRQDPDVVLVGEIRDEETARIAIQAALTGHLVLSSLHTNDAPGAITRLRNFGVPSFAINAALLCAVAQRLVKRVCEGCSQPDAATPELLARFGMNAAPAHLRRGVGCPRCATTGYRGRVGLYEIMRMTPGLQRCVDREVAGVALRVAAVKSGMAELYVDGVRMASMGVTTLEEVARVAAVTQVDDADDAKEIAPAPTRSLANAAELRMSA
jgi:type IV pilus assembly protein PilB